MRERPHGPTITVDVNPTVAVSAQASGAHWYPPWNNLVLTRPRSSYGTPFLTSKTVFFFFFECRSFGQAPTLPRFPGICSSKCFAASSFSRGWVKQRRECFVFPRDDQSWEGYKYVQSFPVFFVTLLWHGFFMFLQCWLQFRPKMGLLSQLPDFRDRLPSQSKQWFSGSIH